MLKNGISFENRDHSVDLIIATLGDLLVLCQHCLRVHKNSVLVVGGNWELGDFNLTLLEVNDHFKVELHLLNASVALAGTN